MNELGLRPGEPPHSRIPRIMALAAMVLLTALIQASPSGGGAYAEASQKIGSSQDLWVVNFGFFGTFRNGSLKRSGTPNAALALTIGDCCPTVTDLTFDSAGKLWLAFIASPAGGQLGELTPDEFKRSKKGEPLRVNIEGGALQYPSSFAFDPAGDLWVSVSAMSNLVEYTPNQLVASGSPTPATTMHFSTNPSTAPSVIRFDPAGNLWLAYAYLPSSPTATAVEFTAAQVSEIKMGGTPAPALSVEAGSNLWLAVSTGVQDPNGVDGGMLEMFNVAGKIGTLSQPNVTISPSAISSINQSLDRPSGLAFDSQGSLWVSNATSSDQVSGSANSAGFIVKFAADQLAVSGSPVPPTILSPNRKGTSLKNPSIIVFGPSVK